MLVAAACDEPDPKVCGPLDAPATGMVASNADVTLTYGTFLAGANNDCPANDPDEPEGLVSLSIFGTQVGGPGLITFCVPRPDLLGQPARSIGADVVGFDIRVVDIVGAADGCSYTIDPNQTPTGTGTGEGVCDAATNQAGFALTLDGTIGLERTCGATIDTISVTLAGRVAVAAQ